MDTLQIMTNHTTVISFQCYCWQCYLSLVLSEIGRICLGLHLFNFWWAEFMLGLGLGEFPSPRIWKANYKKRLQQNGIQLPPRSLNIAPQKLPGPNRKVVCQPPFSGELLNFRGVYFCRCFFVDRFCTFVLVFFFSVRGEAPIRAPSIYYLIAWLFQASDGDIRSSPHIYVYICTRKYVYKL